MIAAAELLRQHGITLTDTRPGRYYTPCPRCSKDRTKPGHKAAKCLGITIERDGGVHWGCNHCPWTGPEKGSGERRSNDLVAYDYVDADGALLFQKVRKPPGSPGDRFFVQRPDGRGGWIKNLEGVPKPRPLYRWPMIVTAMKEDREIAIVEGEKDTDRLWSIGIPATRNFDGATDVIKNPKARSKWKAEYSEALRGARIVVFNDNDAPGYAHADTVCKLSQGIATRVRRLDVKNNWPGIPKGGDVSDWLAIGGEHTAEKLKALIASAPDYVPADHPKPDPDDDDDDAELERLARLPRLEYERARKAAAEKLGIKRLSALDAEVAAKQQELGLDTKEDGKQGRPIEFQEAAPWDQPVDGAQLLGAMVEILGRYVVMSEHQRVAIALWLMHAYLIDRSMISPRLAIRSPIKGCGKTTLLDVLTRLVPRALATANVSPSAIYRVIAAHRPTLLIDEADTLFKDGDETLRGILNAGHRQGGTVLRSVGDEHEPRAFPCYAATVIALIGQLPGTLADRSVDIVLARRRPNEAITPFRLDRTESLDTLARQIARWAKDNSERLGVTDPTMPPGIYNRAADNWRPLLAIAEAVGGDEWPEKARIAAVALVGGEVDEVSRTELLLSDIRTIFSALKLNEISSADLIERLCEIVPRPWNEMGRPPKPMTQNKLARLLRPLAIAPELITEKRISGYQLERFDEAFARYLGPEGVSNLSPSPNPITMGVSDLFATSQPETPREVSKSQKSNNDGPLRGREVAKGGNGHTDDIGLPIRALDALAAWYEQTRYDRRDEADIDAWLNRELRRRLRDDYGVLPEFVESEVKRVIQRVFKLADARTRDSFQDIPF